jgi:hypothetical protein
MGKLFDCVLEHKNNHQYFFKGLYYSKYDPGVGVLEGYPKLISANWPAGGPTSGNKSLAQAMADAGWDSFDCCLPKSNYKAYYFFRGNKYMRYNPGEGVPNNYPLSIDDDHWDNMWEDLPGPYDAAHYSKFNNRYYFFKGAKYLRYKPGSGVGSSYPRPIAQEWNGLGTYFPPPYMAVTGHHSKSNITYFFKDDDTYVRYKSGIGVDNREAKDKFLIDGTLFTHQPEYAYPQSTSYRWKGVWAFNGVSALTLGTFKTYTEGNETKIGPTFSMRLRSDATVSMDPIPGLELKQLSSSPNIHFRGFRKWFLVKGLPSRGTATITLRQNNAFLESFEITNALEPGSTRSYRFAMSSCIYDSRQIQTTIPTVDQMVKDEPAFMLWNGDTSYYVGKSDNDLSGESDVEAGDMKSQHNMFLRMYATRHHPSVANAVRKVPAISTWDDHDFGYNNATGAGGSKQMTPQQIDDAQEVFRTCWPNDYVTPGPFNSIEHSFIYGNTTFYLPDGRTYRDPDNQVILGPQVDPLINAMVADPNPLKVLVLGSQLISTRDKEENFFHDGGGDDEGGERMKLLRAFEDRVEGRVLVLTGDVHFGELSWWGVGGPTNPSVVEVTSSPLLFRQPQKPFGFTDPKDNDQRVWSFRGNNYTMINIGFSADGSSTITIELRDNAGETGNIFRSGGGSGSGWRRCTGVWTSGALTQAPI